MMFNNRTTPAVDRFGLLVVRRQAAVHSANENTAQNRVIWLGYRSGPAWGLNSIRY